MHWHIGSHCLTLKLQGYSAFALARLYFMNEDLHQPKSKISASSLIHAQFVRAYVCVWIKSLNILGFMKNEIVVQLITAEIAH